MQTSVTRGQPRFIVNIRKSEAEREEEYVQWVRVGVCAMAGAGCALGQDTRCQQEFLEHRLVALGETNCCSLGHCSGHCYRTIGVSGFAPISALRSI